MAVSPAAARAAAPTATTLAEVSVSAAGAQLSGQGTTGGQNTDNYFQYAVSSDAFCTSGGVAGTPSSTPAQRIPGLMTPFGASVTAGGLSGGATYCFRFVAVNADGSAYGALDTFSFVVLPGVQFSSVTTTGATTATVNVGVEPSGQPTTIELDYDLAGSPFCTTGGRQPAADATTRSLPADGSWHMLSLRLTSLLAGERYCAEIVAHNPSGTTTSFGGTFTAGVPLVQPGSTVPIGATAALVTGTVDPVGQATSYDVAYDALSSTWCRSGGTSGAPSLATRPVPLPFTDAAYHLVTLTVRGLSPRIGYCLALIAHNPSGMTPSGTPTPLPAMPKLTVFAINARSLALSSPSGGLVTSTPAGISCSRRCSAAFPRGTRVTLHATPGPGSGFVGWNPCFGGSCLGGPSRPLSSSYAVTLSADRTAIAAFIHACTLRPTSRVVRNGRISLKATCSQPMPVSLTGTLTEIPTGHAQKRTYSLPRRQMTITGTRNLEVTLPRRAVSALRHGAHDSATITLTYSGWVIGQATSHINHLTA